MSLLSEEPVRKNSELGNETWVPSNQAERAAVREQLAQIVASPLFRQSKRCPRLLTHVVELAINGHLERLKERTLGVEIFEHEPDYDTNQYPVVRTTAHEVRKRLAQYYQEPGHESEIRIDLPSGCYVPEFRMPQSASEGQNSLGTSRGWWLFGTAIVIVVLVTAAMATGLFHSQSDLDRFWAPVWDSRAPVLLSVGPGGPFEGTPLITEIQDPSTTGEPSVNGDTGIQLGDATALASIGGYLKSQDVPYHVQSTSSIQFQDLKTSPVVFLGPMTRWMEILAPDLRFSVLRNDEVTLTWIGDTENPDDRTWSMEVGAPLNSVIETYALVTRMRNQTTGQMIVSVAGLSPQGTGAAGEFISDADYMSDLASGLPEGWDQRNMQIVIATQRVGRSYGNPRLLATHFW